MALRAGVLLLLEFALAVCAIGQTVDEYQLKAAYLYNLAKFVEWPAASFKSDKDPIVVCMLGQNRVADALEPALRGKAAGGRPFIIRPVSDAQQASGCQILFVSSSERSRWKSIHLEVSMDGVLTVGEADTFLAEGGIVNFKLDDGKIRIQINVEAAAQKHLQISSKLLSLAEIVKK
jgi:hypothetical protein